MGALRRMLRAPRRSPRTARVAALGPRRQLAVASVLLPLLLAVGACGGGDDGSEKVQRPFLRAAQSAPPHVGSAGAADNYVPTGRIVADSGFRPAVHGFSFEN